MKISLQSITAADLRQMLRPRSPQAHKGTMGHALLVAGSKGMAGAAILASEACLRSGVGKLSICTEEDNRIILQISVPEAILKLNRDFSQPYTAAGIGSGLGLDNKRLMHDFMQCVKVPTVYDADALNLLACDESLLALLPAGSILTPHLGEARRLVGCDRVEVVSEYAQTHKVYVALKGHPTHVCTPEGDVVVLDVGNPGMATAGSGDVLTGIVTGLLAQGYAAREAVLLGVWLHGTAGDFAAEAMGENCMLARDIICHLPHAFRKLENK